MCQSNVTNLIKKPWHCNPKVFGNQRTLIKTEAFLISFLFLEAWGFTVQAELGPDLVTYGAAIASCEKAVGFRALGVLGFRVYLEAHTLPFFKGT